MAILIGHAEKTFYSSVDGTFHLLLLKISQTDPSIVIVFRGMKPPRALKTVQYILRGNWTYHAKYGKQLEAIRYERFIPKPSYEFTATKEAIVASNAIEQGTRTNEYMPL